MIYCNVFEEIVNKSSVEWIRIRICNFFRFTFSDRTCALKTCLVWNQKLAHLYSALKWIENIKLLVLYFELTSKLNFSQMLEFNARKFCLNKFDFKFASIFDYTFNLVLKLVEVNLMGAKGLLNQTLWRSRPVFERINF
jgi:hypothetical protein